MMQSGDSIPIIHRSKHIKYLFCSASSDLSIVIKIGSHLLRIVELDGFSIEEKTVNQLMLSPGETARIIPIPETDIDTSEPVWIEVTEAGVLMGSGAHEQPLNQRKSHAMLIPEESNEVADNPLLITKDISAGPIIANVPWTKTFTE